MDCCSGGGNNQSHGRQNVSHTDRFNEEAESNKGRNFQLAIVDSSNELDCCPYVHSQPIKDPIWR
uniref:Uncharacterized protein n=1 Tax=Rhizophora mucronata TaxID=61149 RepID=A0A2P2IIZ6_RHIMU